MMDSRYRKRERERGGYKRRYVLYAYRRTDRYKNQKDGHASIRGSQPDIRRGKQSKREREEEKRKRENKETINTNPAPGTQYRSHSVQSVALRFITFIQKQLYLCHTPRSACHNSGPCKPTNRLLQKLPHFFTATTREKVVMGWYFGSEIILSTE